jgi:DNA mismatch repair ATPase MutS
MYALSPTHGCAERRLNLVELLVTDNELRKSLQEQHLRGVPDLERIVKRLQRGNGKLEVNSPRQAAAATGGV